MVISQVSCGLGNQLFQYATARSLAARRCVPLKLDLEWFRAPPDLPGLNMFTRDYRLNEFNIVAEIATPKETARYSIYPLNWYDPRRIRGPWWRFLRRYLPEFCAGMHIVEQGTRYYPELLRLPGDVYLDGFWQNERYFEDFSGMLRSELTLRDPKIIESAAATVDERRAGSRPVVAVQVRRGDVARAHEVLQDLTNMPYELVSREYLQSAMSVFGDEATFLVFSETEEDIAWCRACLFARDIHFVSGQSDLHDFAAISRCDHQIISNSSFGWWAAWLNPNSEKTVIAPRRWYRQGYALTHGIHASIPRMWLVR